MISINHQTTETPSKPCLCHVLSLLFSTLIPATRKSEKSTRRSHYDAYTRQIVKSSVNHPTTETPSKKSQNMFWKQVLSFFLHRYFQQLEEKWKSIRRSHYDAYTRQIVKSSINHQTTETPSKACFVMC